MFKKLILLFLTATLALSACGTLEVGIEQPPSSATATPEPTTTPAPTLPSQGWKTYSNSEYGFSIDYPADFEITSYGNTASLDIGEQIHVWISEVDPLECRGDCPVIENTEAVIVAGLDMSRVTGYIGAIGGNVPQRYMKYILPRGNQYYSFTLQALSLHTTIKDYATIWPLKENDISLFEKIMQTLKFSD